MRWRFADNIDAFEAWASIHGRKTVSLEEYSLLEPLGRKGSLPESLVVESCVHFSRWLVAASSRFQQSCILKEIKPFVFDRDTVAGAVLSIAIETQERADDELSVACDVTIGGQSCGHGNVCLSLVPLREMANPEDVELLWRELYGKA
jgi:hypothetical protein